ncbi:helix-turn-helix domain-containing protein [Alicyclobacillus fodiniaquatilis]|uniref:Helix-turn-helix domain-containing protein n=1 Tax=Alicyclobacillus fodiniaquatilis TaxID=1661150 RepID=A0ABW4JLI6_9BACL
MNLGQKLRELREQKNWTLAEASAATGISVSHLSAIENGNRPNPSFSLVAKLARAYGVPLSYFDTMTDSNQNTPMIASETPAEYMEIAKRLAEAHALDDPSKLLEWVAKYLRDRETKYHE